MNTSIFFISLMCLNLNPAETPRGDLLGQTPPGTQAQLFAPGFISTGLTERDLVFSPDGRSCYFWVLLQSVTVIMESHRGADDSWSTPQVAPFSGSYADFEPCISPDGNRLFFVSNRPQPQKPQPGDTDIWVMDRKAGKWGTPTPLPKAVNTDAIEFFPSLTRSGVLYFGRYATDFSRCDLYRAVPVDGVYDRVEKLPAIINGALPAHNALISPDERFLVFLKETGTGQTAEFQIAYRSPSGEWGRPISLDARFNPSRTDDSARLSPDGRFLFFSAVQTPTHGGLFSRPKSLPKTGRLTLAQMLQFHNGPQNGGKDIYWISTDALPQ